MCSMHQIVRESFEVYAEVGSSKFLPIVESGGFPFFAPL